MNDKPDNLPEERKPIYTERADVVFEFDDRAMENPPVLRRKDTRKQPPDDAVSRDGRGETAA